MNGFILQMSHEFEESKRYKEKSHANFVKIRYYVKVCIGFI